MKTYPTKAILILALSSLLCMLSDGIQAQSIKKIYSDIVKGDIVKAEAEIHEFSAKNLRSETDVALFGMAVCLIFSDDRSPSYDPYKALDKLGIVSGLSFNRTDADEFLSRYSLSFEQVKEKVYQRILDYAKKIDTEEAYAKALDVCEDCTYKTEAAGLKVKAAFRSASATNTVTSFSDFLIAYSNSEYAGEAKKAMEELAFKDAKSNGSIEHLNNYIAKYPDAGNRYLPVARHMRDSIAYTRTGKSYFEYLKYTQNYPDSEYNEEIKRQLPDLLFNDAFRTRRTDLLEHFIYEYPLDNRIKETRTLLEDIYYSNLINRLSLSGFEKFKREFPESKYINSLTELYSKVAANNDLSREGLNGPVMSVVTNAFNNYRWNKYEESGILKKSYDDAGNLTEIKGTGSVYDEIEEFLDKYDPGLFNENKIRIAGIGSVKPELQYFNAGTVKIEYQNGLLSKVSGTNDREYMEWRYYYDASGNLVTKDVNNSYGLMFKTKYMWENGKLKYKHVYKANGKEFDMYDIAYNGNTASIDHEYFGYDNYSGRKSKIMIKYNNSNQIVQTTETDNYSYDGPWATRKTYDYSYENGKLKSIRYQFDRNDRTWVLDMYIYKPGTESLITYNISRDTNGQITSISSLKETEWEYKYDPYGNWIERTEFEVKRNDIEIRTIEAVVKRTITYY